MDPLLEFVPDSLTTSRLVIRSARASDGAALNAAVVESLDALRPYMPWAQVEPTLAQTESECRRMHARFLLREDLAMLIFERRSDGSEGGFIGGTGLHRIDWAQRQFEIGYWCRTSANQQGFVTEAVQALMRLGFDVLDARRLEVRMDDGNDRSRHVAERAGFRLEGVMRGNSLTPGGELRDTRVYALVRGDSPMPQAT